jgi:hypothetical protein
MIEPQGPDLGVVHLHFDHPHQESLAGPGPGKEKGGHTGPPLQIFDYWFFA